MDYHGKKRQAYPELFCKIFNFYAFHDKHAFDFHRFFSHISSSFCLKFSVHNDADILRYSANAIIVPMIEILYLKAFGLDVMRICFKFKCFGLR